MIDKQSFYKPAIAWFRFMRGGAAGVLMAFGMAMMIAGAARAERYPAQPVKLVVPFPPGGANDIVARLIAPRLGSELGQPVVVENRGGASGTIGAAAVARSKPDGYTLMMAAVPFVITPSYYPDLSYDIDNDFAPISLLTKTPFLLAVSSSLDVKDVNALIARAAQDPEGVTYSSPGAGSPAHLAGALIGALGEVALTHVPYKGGAPAILGVMSGQVGFTLATPAELLPYADEGRLSIIGSSTARPVDFLADIPTLQDQGLDGYEVSVWYGLVAPAGTPDPIVARVNEALEKVMQLPDVQTQLGSAHMEAATMSPEAFGEFLAAEREKWAGLADGAQP